MATVSVSLGGVTSSGDIEIHPGPPRYMYLSHDITEIEVNSGETVEIEAQVEDRYHNPVENGIGIDFTTDLGTVDEAAVTDENGVGYSTFSPGIQAGSATITALADSASAETVISVISNELHSIEFTTTEQVDIQVQGTGGQESYELTVNLKDMNGNMIDEDKIVYFELLNSPVGTNINNVGIIDSTMSSHGTAVVSINSGSQSGTVEVKAYSYVTQVDTHGEEVQVEISATKNNIVVHSGPPDSVIFTVGGHDEAVNMGGGVWLIQVGAMLNDSNGNPIANGTTVYFSLPDDPDYATIETGSAYVGNENTEGDSLPGMAYSQMSFLGSHSLEDVNVRLQVGELEFFGSVNLPPQFLVIDITAIPLHVDWIDNSDVGDNKQTLIQVTVKDGQNNPIHDQTINFTGSKGTPLSGQDPEDYVLITDEEGKVEMVWDFMQIECPPPAPDGTPGTTTAIITAHLFGQGVTNNITVILIRYI